MLETRRIYENRRRRQLMLLGIAALLLTLGTAAWLTQHSSGAGRRSTASREVRALFAQARTARVTDLRIRGDHVLATGRATRPGADVTRTLWYETVAGTALAKRAGVATLRLRVLGESGRVLSDETKNVALGNAPLSRRLNAAQTRRITENRAKAAGVRVVGSHYMSFLGGTAELVVQPTDPPAFFKAAGERIAELLGPLAQGAYLVTVVNGAQEPQLILGFTPGVGGSAGEGVAWQDPSISTDAVWGVG